MTEAALDTDEVVEETAQVDEASTTEEDDEHVFSVNDEEKEPDADEKAKAAGDDDDFKSLKEMYQNQATEFETLKTRFENLEKEKNAIAYQLRTAKKDTKKDDEPVEFTDAQLQTLLEEHRDDPAAMLQIMKLTAQQALNKGKKETLNEVEISGKKKEMDAFLHKTYPDLTVDGSEFRQQVDASKDYLGISDHPFGDTFAVGAMVLNKLGEIIEHAREEGKKMALGEKAEDIRKQNIKSNKLSVVGDKKKTSSVSTSKIDQVAKQTNMTPSQKKIYAKLMESKKSTVSVEG